MSEMVRGVASAKGQQQQKPRPRPCETDMNEMDLDVDMHLAAGGDDIHTAKKRSSAVLDDQDPDFGNEMQKMLEGFGADISKTLLAKRKRLQQYTQTSLKSTHKKVEDTLQAQHGERERLISEFDQHIGSVFQQWETDLAKSKDNEEKLMKLITQQQKLLQQTRIAMSQRLKTAKQLQEHFVKGMRDLGKCHQDQQSGVRAELAKEMAVLQKRILMDTQQQEMANVRKSLQTMLF